MNKNDTFPDSADWDDGCNMLISELREKNVKKIALVGIRDYIFETFLAQAFWKAGIATIVPEFKAREEIKECENGDDLRPFLARYSKLGAQAVICENSDVLDAACKCGICAQMVRLDK